MENLRQALYNFHRNQVGGVQHHPCVSTSSSVLTSGLTTVNTPQQFSNSISQQTSVGETSSSKNLTQMPLIGSSASESPSNSLILDQQQHVVLMTNNTLVSNNSENTDQRIKTQKVHQQPIHRPINMSPMNVPLSNNEHALDGVVVGNRGDDGAAKVIGAAGGEGPTCIAASAANKSSDDSSDCQG